MVDSHIETEEKERSSIESLISQEKVHRYERLPIIKSKLDIHIRPLETTLFSMKFEGRDGEEILGLVLPIIVENRSRQTVIAELYHEGFGGEWPTTDLQAFISDGRSSIRPVYLVGEKDSSLKPITLRPAQSIQLDLRMDWPGTGSVHSGTLMSRDEPATYQLRLILFFNANGQAQYTVSDGMFVNVAS